MSSKLRVYEVARDLKIENKQLVALLHSVGVSDVKNHMSVVPPEALERVKRHLEKRSEPKVVEERIAPTVVKRRTVGRRAEKSAPSQPIPSSVEPAPPHKVRRDEAEPVATPPSVEASVPSVEPVSEPVVASRPTAEELSWDAASSQPEVAAPSAPKQTPGPQQPEADTEASASADEPPREAQSAPLPVEPESVPAAPAADLAGNEPAEPASRVKESPAPPGPAATRTAAPRTGIEVWEGRPGVPMSQAHRAPVPRRVQYDAKAGAGNLPRRPGQPAPRGTRGTRGKGPSSMTSGGFGRGGGTRTTGAPPVTQERGAHKRVVKIESSIGLQTLAGRMGIKAHEVLRKLITLGMTGVNINSTLEADTAKIVASEFAWDVEDVAVSEEQALVIAQGLETESEEGTKEPRAPVVTVMGHVDHGKTSLLDRIRRSNVVAGEAGGITQHIGAYSVETPRGRITFLDTPGHEAFTAMRARGAQTTDIVILVVAADDGVMPQTREAAAHAKNAKVPIVVAVNKCDKPDAQPERVRRELGEVGLIPEEWGGDTLFSEVSAHSGQGIDDLLDKVLLQAEMLDLRANAAKPAVGVVLEAELDRGRGPVASVLITEGTLQRGDIVLAGAACGKVRGMLDSLHRNVASAGPSTPVEVIGLNDVPAAGDPVHVLRDLKKAQEIADSRKSKERRSLKPAGGQRLTLEDLYKAMGDTEQLELKVIVKGDVHGSVEAVSDALTRLSTEKVKVTVVNAGVGAITEGDVNLAVAAGAIIIGFNIRPAGKAALLAQQERIEIRQYNIIYNVVDDVKAAMEGLLAPSLVEKVLGKAEVRQVFRVSKAGNVAGCMVIEGTMRRSASLRLVRDSAVIWQGKFSSLKRFKDDVREVKEGFDCGISLDGYQDVKEADVLECFEVEEVRQTL